MGDRVDALEWGSLPHAKTEAAGASKTTGVAQILGRRFVVRKIRLARLGLFASMMGAVLFLAGCQHHLVAAPGDTTVAIYPDRQTYDKLADLKKSGPLGQLASGLGKGVETKNVDDKTPVKIISSDDEGDTIEVTDGPNAGTSGFVPKNSVSQMP
jgi:hypothetical protein